jgi:hypothetical protein
MPRVVTLVAFVLTALTSAAAAGHIELLAPSPRNDALKSGPCGAGAGDVRGQVVSTFRPGQTITVRWQEFVAHPGYYRISFDADGQDDFVDPAAPGEPTGDASVLIDNIGDREGTEVYEQAVTLPDIECSRCTLQVVQVMTDKPPYGDGNDLYYQCADLVLATDEPETSGAPAEDPMPEAAGCECRGTAGGLPGLAMALGLLLRRRRTRSEARFRSPSA